MIYDLWCIDDLWSLPILDTLQKMSFFAGERGYSHWYQKTKGLKYPSKIDLEKYTYWSVSILWFKACNQRRPSMRPIFQITDEDLKASILEGDRPDSYPFGGWSQQQNELKWGRELKHPKMGFRQLNMGIFHKKESDSANTWTYTVATNKTTISKRGTLW